MKNALLALFAIAAAALALTACSSTSTTAPATTTGDVVDATLTVVGGEPEGGIQTIELTKGQEVKLTVNSDQPYEIHLHGYDIMKDAGPDAPAVFAFNANIDGVFEIEVEDTATQIAKLVVNP
jgi:hypothetical protein